MDGANIKKELTRMLLYQTKIFLKINCLKSYASMLKDHFTSGKNENLGKYKIFYYLINLMHSCEIYKSFNYFKLNTFYDNCGVYFSCSLTDSVRSTYDYAFTIKPKINIIWILAMEK